MVKRPSNLSQLDTCYCSLPNIEIHFLEDVENEFGLFKSKAVGEPPLLYGLGAYFAIRNAIKAFNPKSEIGFNSPLTPEKALINLYHEKKLVRLQFEKSVH